MTVDYWIQMKKWCSLRSWRDFARKYFCFDGEAVNASGKAARELMRSGLEFPPASFRGLF